jgi:hypothetical protein
MSLRRRYTLLTVRSFLSVMTVRKVAANLETSCPANLFWAGTIHFVLDAVRG